MHRGAFYLIGFTNWHYEITTCNEEKFDIVPPDLVLYKNSNFLEKNMLFCFPTIIWIFEIPDIYKYIYI